MKPINRQARHGAVLALTILSLAWFPLAGRTVRELHVADREIIAHLRELPMLAEMRQPRSGEYVLPSRVQLMIHFLRTVNASTFRFSPGIAGDGPTMQRLVEGAYPMRVEETAAFYLFLAHEAPPPGCRVIMAEGGVALAHCP